MITYIFLPCCFSRSHATFLRRALRLVLFACSIGLNLIRLSLVCQTQRAYTVHRVAANISDENGSRKENSLLFIFFLFFYHTSCIPTFPKDVSLVTDVSWPIQRLRDFIYSFVYLLRIQLYKSARKTGKAYRVILSCLLFSS